MAKDPSQQPLANLGRQASSLFAPLQREIDRAFDDFGRGLDHFDLFGPAPSVDLAETEKAYEITAEAPGMTDKDVKVSFEDDLLTISGEKRSETEKEGRNYRFAERRYGSFSRSLRLPGADPDKISAELKDGVLRVTAAKRPDASARRIDIKVGKA
ncbi:Hsp20/alpha crystallin family protein [Brevundimonas sp. 2R-24]|uniref:Hsp20/alpha crystallin family protein n=1 Tax=Peiella sedimenti TaxID=3061083 RepID=A0ABT8SQ45_9CAUL|nr:Hsp20/alpha crystallin family protein [Caulobacteraceae bacterium XZ-24]